MFRPLLAANADLSKLRFPLLSSPKLDGIRCIILDGKPVSRTLKPIPNEYIQLVLTKMNLPMLDGELIVGQAINRNVFNITTRAVMSRHGVPEFTYYVFDIVNNEPFYERLNLAKSVIYLKNPQVEHSPYIEILGHKLITNPYILFQTEVRTVAQGFEGIMLRDPQGRYKQGRSTADEGILLKLKRFVDDEATIIGFEEMLCNLNEATVDERGYTKRSLRQDGQVPADTLGALTV